MDNDRHRTSPFTFLFVAFCLLLSVGRFRTLARTDFRLRATLDRTVDDQLTVLEGNTHPLARADFDSGLAPPWLPMERMLLVLKRSSEAEAALSKLLDEQLDPASKNFHNWITPEQFGQRFGPSDRDIENVTSWLSSHGFEVGHVPQGRTIIEFSGTAREVWEAFHTEIHKY